MSFLLLNLIVALLFTAITTFAIGVFVLVKSWRDKTNRIFAFYSFSIAWWSFAEAFLVSANSHSFAIIFSKTK